MYKVCFTVSLGDLKEDHYLRIPGETADAARATFWKLFEKAPAIKTDNTFWPLPTSKLVINTVKPFESPKSENKLEVEPEVTDTATAVKKVRKTKKAQEQEQVGIKPAVSTRRKR